MCVPAVAAVVPPLVAAGVGLLGAVTLGFAAVMGVTVMPTTSPFTLFFCFDPIVPLALRVDARLAAEAALASTVGVAFAFGLSPKSARASS